MQLGPSSEKSLFQPSSAENRNPAGEEDQEDYDGLCARKERELSDINLKRVETLERALGKLKQENAALRSSLASIRETADDSTARIKEYETKFASVRDTIVEKNVRIEELGRSLESERKAHEETLKKAKIAERTWQEKCETLREELRSAKRRQGDASRDLNSEAAECRQRLKLTLEAQESKLTEQRQLFEGQLKRELAKRDADFSKEKAGLLASLESKAAEITRIAADNAGLGRHNDSLKGELQKLKAEVVLHKQTTEQQTMESSRKLGELHAKIVTIAKENEFSLRSREAAEREMGRKLQAAAMEKQSVELELKSEREKHALQTQTMEEAAKLGLQKAALRYESTIKGLEQSLGEKRKEIDQLALDLQMERRKGTELERKLLLEQSSRGLVVEKEGEQAARQIREAGVRVQEKENEVLRHIERNNQLEIMLASQQEELKKQKAKAQELESALEESRTLLSRLRSSRNTELEEARLGVQSEYEDQVRRLVDLNKKLQRESAELRLRPATIPFLEEPYRDAADTVKDKDTKQEIEEKRARVLELETENSELKAAVEEMREEMDRIKNELIPDIVPLQKSIEPTAERRLVLELERANLKQREAETKVALAEKGREQQQELLIRYRQEIEGKELENQQLRKTVEGLQNKLVTMKSERDRLVDISNGLRVELNTARKRTAGREDAEKSYRGKLDKLKRDYGTLDRLGSFKDEKQGDEENKGSV